MSSVFEQPQTTKKRDGRQPGRALRYAKGFARGLLHHPTGHYHAPIEHVFNHVSDFQIFERAAMRRGVQVKRTDNLDVKAPGMSWQADFEFRGKKRVLEIELEDIEAPTNMDFLANSGGLTGACEVELIALSPNKTRLKLGVELKPQTLSARLLVQSLKLAKGNVEKRMKARLAEFSEDVSTRYKQTQTA